MHEYSAVSLRGNNSEGFDMDGLVDHPHISRIDEKTMTLTKRIVGLNEH